MLRVSRRTCLAITALFAAISILVVLGACGETLPVSENPTAIDAGPDTSTSETSNETDSGTDSAGDANEDGAKSDGPCTTGDSYGDASLLENFDGLGAVSSVRISRDGGVAYVSADLGNATEFDLGELTYPPPPSPLPASI